jgi:hypothetical protein
MIAARSLTIIWLCFSSVLLTACSDRSSTDFKSPDGSQLLRMGIADPGAMGTARAKVHFIGKNANGREVEELVFAGDGWPIGVRWIDNNHAVISACGARNYKYGKTALKKGYGANPNIQLVVEPTVINHTYYCS